MILQNLFGHDVASLVHSFLEYMISIDEIKFKSRGDFEGYIVKTTKQVIVIKIECTQRCCEDFGSKCLTRQGSLPLQTLQQMFVNSQVENVCWSNHLLDSKKQTEFFSFAAINISTSEGTLQLFVYNEHNGYYPHDVINIYLKKICKNTCKKKEMRSKQDLFMNPKIKNSGTSPFFQEERYPEWAALTSLKTGVDSDKKGNIKRSKRSVSAVTKKIVAASQLWSCAKCNKILPANFEVDHVTALHMGGSNEIENLNALCRDCHGFKTFFEMARFYQN